MNIWAHTCDSTGKFTQLPMAEECKSCGINNAVSVTRNAGFIPLPVVKKIEEKPSKRIAALFLPFKRTNKINNDEYENEFYDRHG